jgi:DNA primase
VLYVVESPLCVVKLHQLGFPAVSTYGWHVSEQQADVIGQLAKGVVWLSDRDKFSEASAHAGALARRVWTKMPELPEGMDAPEYLSPDQIRALT